MSDLVKSLQEDIIFNYKKNDSSGKFVYIYDSDKKVIFINNNEINGFYPGDGYVNSNSFSSFIWDRYKKFNLNE